MGLHWSMTSAEPDLAGEIRLFFAQFERAHRREDVDSYLRVFTPDTVWVTSRGACLRGRATLGEYLHRVIPGGLAGGSVDYVVESVQMINPATVLAVIEQTYLDAAGHPRDGNAGHTHLYVLTSERGNWQIAAGQNTVRS